MAKQPFVVIGTIWDKSQEIQHWVAVGPIPTWGEALGVHSTLDHAGWTLDKIVPLITYEQAKETGGP